MAIFVDTSAIFSVLHQGEENHDAGQRAWDELQRRREILITTNYVLLETVVLVARRLGFAAIRSFQTEMAPLFQVYWMDEALHDQAVAAFLTVGQRNLSLVDCASFEVMRRLQLDLAFVFDAHFLRQGFRCLP